MVGGLRPIVAAVSACVLIATATASADITSPRPGGMVFEQVVAAQARAISSPRPGGMGCPYVAAAMSHLPDIAPIREPAGRPLDRQDAPAPVWSLVLTGADYEPDPAGPTARTLPPPPSSLRLFLVALGHALAWQLGRAAGLHIVAAAQLHHAKADPGRWLRTEARTPAALCAGGDRRIDTPANRFVRRSNPNPVRPARVHRLLEPVRGPPVPAL